MKYIYMFFALAIGLIIGSWIPRSQLREARLKIEKLEQKLAQKSTNPMVTDVASMLSVASMHAVKQRREKPVAAATPEPDITPEVPESAWDEAEFNPDDLDAMKEHFDAVRDIWLARSAQNREALIEALDLTESEIESFDDIIDAMNQALKTRIEDIVDDLEEKETINTRDTLEILNTVATTILDTYTELDDTLPGDWEMELPETVDIAGFIDPGVIYPFVELGAEMSETYHDE